MRLGGGVGIGAGRLPRFARDYAKRVRSGSLHRDGVSMARSLQRRHRRAHVFHRQHVEPRFCRGTPQYRNGSVQIPAIRSEDLQQSLKSMVMFEFWFGGPYRTQARSQLGEVPSCFVTKNSLQKLKCRLREPRVQFRFMKWMRDAVRILQRLQPGADLLQCLWKCVACCDARPAEAL